MWHWLTFFDLNRLKKYGFFFIFKVKSKFVVLFFFIYTNIHFNNIKINFSAIFFRYFRLWDSNRKHKIHSVEKMRRFNSVQRDILQSTCVIYIYYTESLHFILFSCYHICTNIQISFKLIYSQSLVMKNDVIQNIL